MDLVAEFQFLSEKTKNSNFTKSTDKGLWEDKSLQSKCRANPLDTNLSMSTKFKIATTFYNWYLVGNTNLDYGFRDALIQALSLACIPDDHWHMTSIFDFSGAQSWYGTLTSTKGLCKNPNKTHRLTELEAKRLYASKNDGIEQIQTTLDDEAVSAHGTLTELYQRLLKLFLEAKAAGQPVSFDRGQRVMFYRYINTAAYLAACAFRLVGKDAETAATIYTKENFRKNIASFGGWVGTSFPRPCTSFVEHLKTGVKRTDSAIMHAFRHIVSVHTKDEVHQLARGFVDSACLLHLKFNGMGAARLLIEAIDVSNLSFSDLMRHMFTESTRSSWRTLATCLNTYHSPDSPHMSKTWSWGKVCDDQYLTYLKPINHVALCAMLHGLLHTGSPKDYESIGEAAWVGQTSRAKYNSHFNYGVNVYNRRCLDIQAMPWNKDLLNSETPVVSAAHDDIKDLQEKEELLTGKKADKTFEKFSEPITEVPDMPDIGEVQNNLIDLEGSLNSTHYLDIPSKSKVVPSAPPLVDRSTSPDNEDLMDLGDEEDQGDDDDDLSGLV